MLLDTQIDSDFYLSKLLPLLEKEEQLRLQFRKKQKLSWLISGISLPVLLVIDILQYDPLSGQTPVIAFGSIILVFNLLIARVVFGDHEAPKRFKAIITLLADRITEGQSQYLPEKHIPGANFKNSGYTKEVIKRFIGSDYIESTYENIPVYASLIQAESTLSGKKSSGNSYALTTINSQISKRFTIFKGLFAFADISNLLASKGLTGSVHIIYTPEAEFLVDQITEVLGKKCRIWLHDNVLYLTAEASFNLFEASDNKAFTDMRLITEYYKILDALLVKFPSVALASNFVATKK